MSAAVSATGIEPRVPQKRTRTASSLLERGGRLGRYRAQRLAHRREDLEHEVEMGDLEDFGHHGLKRRDEDAAMLRLRLPRSEHEARQPSAGDGFKGRQVEP